MSVFLDAGCSQQLAVTTELFLVHLRKLFDGEGMQSRLFSKSLDVSALQRAWTPIQSGSAVIRSTAPTTATIVTRGPTSAKSIVRLELVSTGEPKWLSEFDANDASDVLRTYGLGRLFESFRQDATNGQKPIAHVYFVVN